MLIDDVLILIAIAAVVVGVAVRARVRRPGADRIGAALVGGGLLLVCWQATSLISDAAPRMPVTLETATLVAAIAVVLVWAAMGTIGFGLRRRPLARPECRRCAYDLTGVTVAPESRCPECGTAFGRAGPRTARAARRWLVAATLLLLAAVAVVRTPHVYRWGWIGAVPDRVMLLGWTWLPERLVCEWDAEGDPLKGRGATLVVRLDHALGPQRADRLLARLERELRHSSSIRRVARAHLLLPSHVGAAHALDARQAHSLVQSLVRGTRSREILHLARRIASSGIGAHLEHTPLALHAAELRAAALRPGEAGMHAFELWLALGRPFDDELGVLFADRIAAGLHNAEFASRRSAGHAGVIRRLMEQLDADLSIDVQTGIARQLLPAMTLGLMINDGRVDEVDEERVLALFRDRLAHGEPEWRRVAFTGLSASRRHDISVEALVLGTVTPSAAAADTDGDRIHAQLARAAIVQIRVDDPIVLRAAVHEQREALRATMLGDPDPFRRVASAGLLIDALSVDDPVRDEAIDELRRLRDAAGFAPGEAVRMIQALQRFGRLAPDS